MGALYAIGDIHGFDTAFADALARIPDAPAQRIVFTGDYLDRGPDARAVVARLMAAQAAGSPWVCLQGNHDTFIGEFLRGPEAMAHWSGPRWLSRPFGGAATLASYGVAEADTRPIAEVVDEARARIPDAHVAWLEALPRLHTTPDHIFVHAGLRPGVALKAQDPEDLIWIREPFLSAGHDFGRLVVHGHTPVETPELHATRLNLDGGAGFGRPVVPVRLEGRAAVALRPDGRVVL